MDVIKKIFEFEVKNKKANKDIKDTKDNIGGVTQETNKLNTATKKTPTFLTGISNGLNVIGVALKALGIGIVIAAFAKFVEVLSRNQRVLDVFNIAMEATSRIINDFISYIIDNSSNVSDFFKSIFENPLQSIKDFGRLIAENITERIVSLVATFRLLAQVVDQVLAGEFKKAFQTGVDASIEFADVITGVDNSVLKLGVAVTKGAKDIYEYTAGILDAADAQVELRKSAALAEAQIRQSIFIYQTEIEQLRQVRDNVEMNMAARIKANDEIGVLLKQQGEEERELAQLRVNEAAADLAANKDNEELKIALINANTELLDIEERIAGFTSEQLLNEQSLREERRTNLQELRKIGKSKEELSKAELETTLENQRILIERNVESKEEEIALLLAAEMEYNEGIQALEDESLAKLKEIRDKYIDEDNIGLSQIEIFEREREVQREAYAKELEDLRESEENKAKLLAEFDTQTVKKKNIVEQSQADAVKKAKNEEVQYYLGATAAITDTLARGSIAAKGFAIAESLFNTFLAMTKALETNAGVPIPGYAIAQAIAIGVFGLAQVANIASTDPTTGSGPGVNSGRGQGNVITQGPRFDTVGDSQNVRDSENNPNQNEPVEAYVVSGKVTNQQALDRNRQNNSRFIG
jgi:hypothetical protein